MDYFRALQYLNALPVPDSWRLERMRELVALGGVDFSSFKSVLVAGTNGKGSVCAMLDGMLRESGQRTGLYTSPHLVDFRERIVFGGKEISEEKVAELAEWVKPFADKAGASYFETVTLMAFKFFADEKADYAVIETGMGGRLDATNVLSPGVRVVTNVSLEHTQNLGSTVEAIASEKAGIIGRGCSVVTACDGVALEVVRKKCVGEGVEMQVVHGKDVTGIRCGEDGTFFSFEGERYATSLLGPHQALNAALAVKAAKLLGVAEQAIGSGLEKTVWPGRLQIVGRNPLVVLDGAHNPGGVETLVKAVKTMWPGKGIVLVAGILKDKEFVRMAELFLGLNPRRVVVVEPETPRALPAPDLAGVFNGLGENAVVGGSVNDGLAMARELAEKDELILVTGSLYTVGDALKRLSGL